MAPLYLLDTNICLADSRRISVNLHRHYGDILAALEHHGTPIGANDQWIAAHARAAGLIMVTANLREFRRVPALTVENWPDEPLR